LKGLLPNLGLETGLVEGLTEGVEGLIEGRIEGVEGLVEGFGDGEEVLMKGVEGLEVE
jgi:hypothetical protein